MGPVFRAYDPEGERLVAIKLFRLDLPPERVHQLVAEFEKIVAARLTHPAIATPVATGIVEASAYLAQEYFPAESLDTVVREHGALPPADALRAAVQLAGALDFAAAAGVDHGGLHPRDVLMAGDQAKLAGLGVGRALERVGAATPVRRPYTAPERISGTEWGSRADVFSLAALVHEMLWARRVSGMGAAAAESLSEIPGGDLLKLRQAFARALDERPDARFETALAFVEALTDAFGEQPPAASDQVPETVNIRQSGRASRLSTIDQAVIAADRRPEAHSEPRLPLDEPAVVGELELRKVAAAPPESFEAEEHTLPGNWPLAFALAIGVAVGFAAGYGVGTRTRSTTPTQAAVPPAADVPDVRLPAPSVVEGKANASTAPAPTPANAVARKAAATSVAASKPAAATATGSVLVRSSPAGAKVLVDGKEYGRTPLTVRDLARGPHRVQVARDGYGPEERRLTITAAKPSQSLMVQLSRERQVVASAGRKSAPAPATPAPAAPSGRGAASGSGPLIVESRPPGAKVFLDGRLVGTTPVSVAGVAAGDHAVRLEHDGYRNWSSSVRIEGSEPSRVTASMER